MRWPVVLLLFLAGCSHSGPTAAMKEAQGITEALRAARIQADECGEIVEQSSAREQLSDRFTLGTPSMAILANKAKPTEADRALLLEIHKGISACRTQGLVNLNLAHSGFVAVMAATYAQADIDFGKLVRGEITWGEYATLSMERRQRHQERWDEAVRTIRADIKDWHASEIAERQRAARALAAWAEAQRVNLPVYTTCTYVVRGLVCQSY